MKKIVQYVSSLYKKNPTKFILMSLLILLGLYFSWPITVIVILVIYYRKHLKKEKEDKKDSKKKCPKCKMEVDYEVTRCPHCRSRIMSDKLKILIAILIGSIILMGILSSNGYLKSNRSEETVTPKILIPTEAEKNKLETLKKNFIYKYDEFQQIGWYTHKTQTVENSFNRTFLQVPLNSEGNKYLVSKYYGENWIFHTRIEVKVGDTIYKSADIPTFSEDHNTQNSGGSVWEDVSYLAGKDNGIIQAIAQSGDAVVKVRFTGGETIKDITLSKKDQQAIKDSYELSELIKKFGNN